MDNIVTFPLATRKPQPAPKMDYPETPRQRASRRLRSHGKKNRQGVPLMLNA